MNAFKAFSGTRSLGFGVSTFKRYNPLINYKWSTTVSSDYITDGVELNKDVWTTDTGWDYLDKILTCDNSQTTYSSASLLGAGEIGDTLLVSFNLQLNSGILQIKGAGAYTTYYPADSGLITEVIVTDSTTFRFTAFPSNTDCIITNISVQKVIQKPNTMYLQDSGTSPKYHAEMFSGQGVKFNGVDQEVLIDNIGTAKSVAFSMDGGTVNTLLFNAWLTRSTIMGPMSIKYYDDNVSYKTHIINDSTGKQCFVVSFDSNTLVVSFYGDGELIDTLQIIAPYHTSKDYRIGNRGGAEFNSGTIKDLYYFSDTLTPTEISKYSTNPNGFFQDVQDGVIDNCVLNMPMDGNGKYVRDYANYAEAPIATTYTGMASSDEIGVFSASDTSISCNITTAGTVSSRPRFEFNIPATTGNDDVWLSFDIALISGSFSMSQIYLLLATDDITPIAISTAGSHKFKLNSTGAGNTRLGIYVQGTVIGHTEFTNIKLTSESGIHEIANHTTSANVSNLNYGTQELNFTRDGLWRGDLSSYLECDGIGYVDTGWIPKASEYVMFEIILEQTNDGSFHLNGTNDGVIQIGNHSVANYIRIKIFGSSHDVIGAALGFNHIVVIHEADSLTFDVYINGGSAVTKSTISNDATTSFILGVQGSLYMDTPIPLFKVHTTPQDPLELYNNAVSKGLLT